MDSHETEVPRGRIVVIHVPTDRADADPPEGLFDREEHPVRVVLAIVAREDAPDLVVALQDAGIGARLGDPTPEEGIEVVVHDMKLPEAQAVLVEFTGDPSLVDDVEPDEDGFVDVSTAPVSALGRMAERLADAGIDVRMRVPEPGAEDHPGVTGTLWVDRDAVTRAREILGISI